jgi:hypothetical protein
MWEMFSAWRTHVPANSSLGATHASVCCETSGQLAPLAPSNTLCVLYILASSSRTTPRRVVTRLTFPLYTHAYLPFIMVDPCDYSDFGVPFDDSDADIILRSLPSASPGWDLASATHFRVHRLFLIKASPEFKRLLCEGEATPSHPGITRDTYDNLPVLCLSEDTETLRSLLTTIYPTDVVYPQTLEAMMKTHAAAKKYGMSSALTLFRTHCNVVAPVMTTKNAFRAFFRAFNSGLKEEALEAARLSLPLPLTFEALDEELYNASGPALEALRGHRKATSQAIGRGVKAYKIEVGDLRGWSSPHNRSGCTELGPGPQEQLSVFAAKIIADFSLINISSFIEVMSSQGFKCPVCGAPLRLNFQRLFRCLERHIDDNYEQASPVFLDSIVDGVTSADVMVTDTQRIAITLEWFRRTS